MPRESKPKSESPGSPKKVYRKIGTRWVDVEDIRRSRAKARSESAKQKKKTPPPLVYSRVYVISDTRANLDPLYRELRARKRLHTRLYRVSQQDLFEIARAAKLSPEIVYFGDDIHAYLIKIQIAGRGLIGGDDYTAAFLTEAIERQPTPLIAVWIHHEPHTPKLKKNLTYVGVDIQD